MACSTCTCTNPFEQKVSADLQAVLAMTPGMETQTTESTSSTPRAKVRVNTSIMDLPGAGTSTQTPFDATHMLWDNLVQRGSDA